MTHQYHSVPRHSEKNQVIPMTVPVFSQWFHRAHPRLQLRTNIAVFPTEGRDDEADLDMHPTLNIFVSGCEALNALEMKITESMQDKDATHTTPFETDEEDIDSALEKRLNKSSEEKESQTKENEPERSKPIRNNFGSLKSILNGYLERFFATSLTNERTNKLTRLLMKYRVNIYELEEFSRAQHIPTDSNGLPVDADMTPISVSMEVFRYAMQTGEEVLSKKSFAFIPKPKNGEPRNGLVGSFDHGHIALVILSEKTISDILACEDLWSKRIEPIIQSTYQQPAPAMGAEQQEREESFDGSEKPSIGPAVHAKPSKEVTEHSFPHFPLEPDPDIDPDD